jgi:uncharacterized protein (TIGR02231 family)
MNKPISLLLLLLVVSTSQVSALTADQKITAVTIYPDRALVTRSGTVRLEPGVQSIVFDRLPLNLEEDSVRAKAQGKLKILGVEVRRDYKDVAVNTATKQLTDDVTKLDDQIRALTDEQGDLRRRNEFLDQIRNKVASQSNTGDGKDHPDSVQNIQGLFQLYGTETSKITSRLREIEFTLRDLNQQRNDKANQLALLQQPATPNTRSAIVTVDAGESGTADLQVTYLISGAGWQPQYDAYADADTQKVELTYYGVVRQSTGENWDNVAITLSSARPSTAARLPELGAWTIDFDGQLNAIVDRKELDFARADNLSRQLAQRSANSTVAVQDKDAADANAPAAAAPQSPAPDAEMATAEVRTLGPAATFIVPARTSIPSDNQPHRSAISVQTLKGEWTYEMTPKLAGGAFLKTKVTNTSGGPLLAGEINAFLGNDFIGKSNIGLVAANATFDLFLGVDDNIKVTRTEGVKKEEVGGILSRMKLYRRSFTIEVQNFKTTEASFKLRDQLPVSKNGQISVVVNKAEPAFKSRDENTGEVNWEFKLKPNEKRTITVEYEINAPYNQSVAGI